MDKSQEIINTFRLQLSSENKLEIKKDAGNGIYKWGKKNDYPKYLIDLYDNSPDHQNIVNGKCRYLTGMGIKPTVENPNIDLFLKKANDKQSWYQLKRLCDKDFVLFRGFAIKVYPNLVGDKPVKFEHISFGRLRKTLSGKLEYSDDWTNRNCERVEYPIWEKGIKEISIFYYKEYSPSAIELDSLYPKPEYYASVLDIETDAKLSNFFNSLVKHNFSAGTLITIFQNNGTKDEQTQIVAGLKGEHTGDEQAGNIVVAFADANGKGAEVLTLNANDLDKQYQEVSKRCSKKIVSAHGVNGALFKIEDNEGKLFTRNDIAEMQELFMNEWVKPNQEPFLETIKTFCLLNTGILSDFEVEQFNLISQELPLDNQAVVTALNAINPAIIQNYLINKYNLNLEEIKTTSIQQDVNEHLKNMSGKQHQNMMRIVSKFQQGKLTKEQAESMLMSGFGLSKEQVDKFLIEPSNTIMAVKMSSQKKDELFFQLFDKYAVDLNEDEVLDVFFVDHKADSIKLAEDLNDNEVRGAVLDQIKANPSVTNEELANAINVPLNMIEAAVSWLAAKKLIEGVIGNFTPTQKGLDSKLTTKTKIYTVYTYEKRPEVSGAAILPTTRDLCKQLYTKTRFKALTYEAINKMTNEFGENVWDYRGGFYNDGEETTPWCRHIWQGQTKIEKS